jgi:hypothetical protein
VAFCGDCGSALQDGKNYCTGCGAFVGSQSDSTPASNVSENRWTEQQFDELSQLVYRMGVNPSQIGTISCAEWDLDPAWNPGEIFVINHQLSGALENFYPVDFWWVDYWMLLRNRWGLLRMKIDDDRRYVSGGPLTPGKHEEFMSEGLPSLDEISSRIWFTTARFLSRVFYPLGGESLTLQERIANEDELPILAIGRLADFVRKSTIIVNEAGGSPSDSHQLDAATEFRSNIPPTDLVRLMNMEWP